MLRTVSGNSVRLTRKDVWRLTTLTGESPASVHTAEELNQFLDSQRAQASGNSALELLYRKLLDLERVKPL